MARSKVLQKQIQVDTTRGDFGLPQSGASALQQRQQRQHFSDTTCVCRNEPVAQTLSLWAPAM